VVRQRSCLSIVVDLLGFATSTFFEAPNFDATRGESSGDGSQFLVNFDACKYWFF